MSIPRVSPNHLLAQRLDALLGTKLAQQLASSTRPTTQAFIPQAPRAPALESAPQAPERPPAPLPQRPPPHTQQPLPQASRQAPLMSPPGGAPPSMPGPELPGTPSAPISLGNTALLLLHLLRHFPSPPPAVSQAQTLLPSAPGSATRPSSALAAQAASAAMPGLVRFSSPTAATLFHALEQAVRQSGLFYESHLAQFTSGRYPRSQLQAESQARMADAPQQGAPAGDTALTLRQQLETLALQTFSWRGEAWPQAEMQWSVSRNDQQGGDADTGSDEPAQWSSRLALTLPKLGDIHAHLHLDGDTLDIRLAAPQAEATLSAQADALHRQLRAAGLSLSRLRIARAFDEDRAAPPLEASPDDAAP